MSSSQDNKSNNELIKVPEHLKVKTKPMKVQQFPNTLTSFEKYLMDIQIAFRTNKQKLQLEILQLDKPSKLIECQQKIIDILEEAKKSGYLSEFISREFRENIKNTIQKHLYKYILIKGNYLNMTYVIPENHSYLKHCKDENEDKYNAGELTLMIQLEFANKRINELQKQILQLKNND